MTVKRVVLATGFVILLAIAANTYISLDDHQSLTNYVHAESVQRVTTIGERCEATKHQATVLHNNLPSAHRSEAEWFEGSYKRCLKSLAKVEARAGVKYQP